MNIPSILGTLETLLGLVRAMPQLVRLLRAGEAFGVSVDTAATSAICSFSWVVYGMMTDLGNLVDFNTRRVESG